MSHNDPFEQMQRFFEQTRRSMYGDVPAIGSGDGDWRGRASISVETTDDAYVARMDLPEFEKDDIAVRFDEGALVIEAERELAETGDAVWSHRKRALSEHVRLPEEIDEAEITATFRNGVLEVHLPRVGIVDDEDVYRIDVE